MTTIWGDPNWVNGFPPKQIVCDEAFDRWHEILPTLCPGLQDAVKASPRNHVHCLFPGHDDFNPSFRIDDLETGSAICTCGQWANGIVLLQALLGCSEEETVQKVQETLLRLGPPLPRTDRPGTSTAAEKQAWALQLWNDSFADDGTLQRYLQGRGLSGWLPQSIRYNPSLQATTKSGTLQLPGAVCLIQKSDGTATSIQRIFLDPHTFGIAKIENPKRLLGQPNGGSVRLAEPNADYLYLCEGVETGLAIVEATGGVPVWACLTTAGLRNANIPTNIRRVVIWADNDQDRAGQFASEELARRLIESGREVWILIPPNAGEDWLDVFNRDRQIIQQVLQTAPPWQPPATVDADDELVGERFPTMTAAELDAADFRVDYFIPSILAKGEFCVVGAPDKTLKTSICGIDLGLSLASGSNFLNHFTVKEKAKVCFLSGESGAATLQSTARRVAQSKGLRLCDVQDWEVSLEIPQLKNPQDHQLLEAKISCDQINVLIIDPAYLALGVNSGESANLFEMGAILKPLIDIMKRTGCTIILIHHFRGSAARSYVPPDLSELSHAGFSAIARQWILLSRRKAYEDDGLHALWMRCGGSAGHSSLWGVDVNEGRQDDPGGRKWDVFVHSHADTKAQDSHAKETMKSQQKSFKDQSKLEGDAYKLFDTMRKFPQGETAKVLRDASGLNLKRFGEAIAELKNRNKVETVEVKKGNNQKYDGYKLKDHHWDTGTVPVGQNPVPVDTHSGTGGL